MEGATIAGRVVDLSSHGMAMESTSPLRVGGRYRLCLAAGGEKRVPVVATVRWCRLTATRRLASGEVAPLYRAGLALHRGGGRAAHCASEAGWSPEQSPAGEATPG